MTNYMQSRGKWVCGGGQADNNKATFSLDAAAVAVVAAAVAGADGLQ